MKFTTIHLAENKIEIFNSWLGKETIKVNGNVTSSKYSFFGAEHVFPIMEQGEEVSCRLRLSTGFFGVKFDLCKNDQPIIESPNNGCLGFFSIFIILGVVAGLLSNALKLF